MSRNPAIAAYTAYAEQSGLAATTRYNRGLTLNRLDRWLQVRHHASLIDASPEMLAEWRAGFRFCQQTVLNYVTDARQFYRWAAESGLRAGNPAERIPVPRAGRRLPRPIATKDLCTAILTAPPQVRIWLILAAFCGLRAKEIAFLRRECLLLDLPEPMLLVAEDATKGQDERMIPMIKLVTRELAAAGMPAHGWLFSRRDGQRGPNSSHTVCRYANRHLHDLGIQATLHQLRHWFGTETYGVNEDLLAVAELMGHRDLRSTRGYAKISSLKKARIMAGLPVPAALQAA